MTLPTYDVANSQLLKTEMSKTKQIWGLASKTRVRKKIINPLQQRIRLQKIKVFILEYEILAYFSNRYRTMFIFPPENPQFPIGWEPMSWKFQQKILLLLFIRS